MGSLVRVDPAGYARLYHAISWTYPNHPPYTVSVHKYLSMNAEVCDSRRIEGATTMRSRLLAALAKDKDAEQMGDSYHIKGVEKIVPIASIRRAFSGTGTPEELRDTLWTATHYGFIVPTADTTSPKGKKATTADKFADWYLGMDCTGFANAFLGLHEKPRSISAFDSNKALRRKGAGDIKSCDVMIRKAINGPYKHIAIVTRALSTKTSLLELHTAEASGERTEGGMEGVTDDKVRQLKMESAGVFVKPQVVGPKEWEIYVYPMP